MNDSPCASYPLNYPFKTFKCNIKSAERKLKFTLMLAAIEENSGKMLKLTEVGWTHEVKMVVDHSGKPGRRIKCTKYQTLCTFNGGKFVNCYLTWHKPIKDKRHLSFLTDILAPDSPVYTVNSLKNVESPPYTCAEKHYSAFRGPKPKVMFADKTYFEKELLKLNKKPPHYYKREPLYLYHGERYCAEKSSEEECRKFLANHFFSAVPWSKTSKMSKFHRGILTDESAKEQLVKWFDSEGSKKLYPARTLTVEEEDYKSRTQYKDVIFKAPAVSDVKFKRLTENPKKVTSSYKKSTNLNDVKSTIKSRRCGNTAFNAPNRVSVDKIREMLRKVNQASSASKQQSEKLEKLYY